VWHAVINEQQPMPAGVSRAQGLQLSSGNTQFNLWLLERQLDAQGVEVLSSSAAASYVGRLSAGNAALSLSEIWSRDGYDQ
jgi:hypothetical protein